MTSAVSVVAANPGVRAELRRRQREWADHHGGGVIEGRDIGSVVFPDAELKVYLTASEDVRAQRRHRGGRARLRGDPRLHRRPGRPGLHPRRQPPARHPVLVTVDTTDLSVDEIVERIVALLGDPV